MLNDYPISPGQLGIRADSHPQRIEPEGLLDAENVIWRGGKLRSRPGISALGSAATGERILGIFQYDHEDEDNRLVMATDKVLYLWDAGTNNWVQVPDDSNHFSGSVYTQVIMRPFTVGGVTSLVCVNGADHPKVWDGKILNHWHDVTGARHARTLAVLQRRLLMGGFADGPAVVEYSTIDDINSGWATHSKSLGNTPGAIMAMMEHGPKAVMIYKTDAIYAAIPYTSETPFAFEPITLGIPGPVSAASVVSVPGSVHAFLAEDAGVYLFDGSSRPELMSTHIQRWIADRWSYQKRSTAFGLYNRRFRELWFFYPTIASGDSKEAVVINLDTGSMYAVRYPLGAISAGSSRHFATDLVVADIGETLMSDADMLLSDAQQQRNVVVLGGANGQAYEQTGYTDAGSAIPGYFETGQNAVSQSSRWTTAVKVDNLFRQTSSAVKMQVSFGYSQRGEDRSFSDIQEWDLSSSSSHRTGHRVSGRMLSLKYSWSSSEEIVYLGSVIQVAVRGRR